MSNPDLAKAHHALQTLKSHPEALTKFYTALSGLSASTGLPLEDATLTYVANALINQRISAANTELAHTAGVQTIGGFHIKASIK